MRTQLFGTGALVLVLAACGGGGSGGGANESNPTNNIAAAVPAGEKSAAQDRLRTLPEAERNNELANSIRSKNLTCQRVVESTLTQATTKLPVYEATCDDGAIYAVAFRDDGSAAVEPMAPARGR